MRNIKKIVAVLLAALLVLMSMPAFAATGTITGSTKLLAPPAGKKSAVEYRLKDASGADITDGATWTLNGTKPSGISLEGNKIIIDGSTIGNGSFTLTATNGDVTATSGTIEVYYLRYFSDFNSLSAGTATAPLTAYNHYGSLNNSSWSENYDVTIVADGENRYISAGSNGALYNYSNGGYSSIKQLTVDYDLKVPTGNDISLFKENSVTVPVFKKYSDGSIKLMGNETKEDPDYGYIYSYDTKLVDNTWRNISVSIDYLNKTAQLFMDGKLLEYTKTTDSSTGTSVPLTVDDSKIKGVLIRQTFDNLAIYSGTYLPPETGTIDGDTDLTITAQTKNYTFKNAAENAVDASDVVWSIENAPHAGVTVSNGTLSVNAEAAAELVGGETFTIVAESASAYVKATKEISFVGMDTGSILGETNLLSPPNDVKSELYYTFNGTDGNAVTASDVVWSLSDAPAGISIEASTGRLILDGSQTNDAGTFKVKAKSATENVAAELEVNLKDFYIYEDFETPNSTESNKLNAYTRNIATNEKGTQEFTNARGTATDETDGNTYSKVSSNHHATKLEWVLTDYSKYNTSTISMKIKADESSTDVGAAAIRDNDSLRAYNLKMTNYELTYKPIGVEDYVSTGVKINPTGWSEIRIVTDFSKLTYRVYVNDTLAVKDVAIPDGASKINQIYMEYSYDDFSLYSGNKIVEDGVWVDGNKYVNGSVSFNNSTVEVIKSGTVSAEADLYMVLVHYVDNAISAIKCVCVDNINGEYRVAGKLEGISGGYVKGFLWDYSSLKPLSNIICEIK